MNQSIKQSIKQFISSRAAARETHRTQFVNTGVFITTKSAARNGGVFGGKPTTPTGFRTVITRRGEYRHVPTDYTAGITAQTTPQTTRTLIYYTDPASKRRASTKPGQLAQLALF